MLLNIFYTFSMVTVCLKYVKCDLMDDLHYYETLKLSDITSRVRRSADPHPSSHVHEVKFFTLGRDFHMYLKQSTILSHDFKASVVHGNGSDTHIKIDHTKFMSGTLKDDNSARVNVHWENDVLTASILTDEDMYFVEPSWRHLDSSPDHAMIAYRKSDLKWTPNGMLQGVAKKSFCDSDKKKLKSKEVSDLDDDIKLSAFLDESHSGRYKRSLPYVGTHTVCRLSLVADHYFHDGIGGGNEHRTAEYLIGMIDRINNIYTKTSWPDDASGLKNLGFEIAEVLVHDEHTVSNNHYNQENRKADMDWLLDIFGDDYVKRVKYCLAHLFTFQSFTGKLGLAYIASARINDAGGICSHPIWVGNRRMAVNTGVSSYKNPGSNTRALTAQAVVTTAHELAHNWGSEHDPDTPQCSPKVEEGGKYIMYPRATSGYQKNNKIFSPCSKRFMFQVIQNKGFICFSEPADKKGALCGNARLENGEECDAGYQGDACCTAKCQLKQNAICSPMNYACCKDCKRAPKNTPCLEKIDDNIDCKSSSVCNGSSLHCPAPRPLTNTPCLDGGNCENGRCVEFCSSRGGQISCICSSEKDECRRCCRKNETSPCNAYNNYVQDGRPCSKGFCQLGVCTEQRYSFIKRLFPIIESFTIDSFVEFLKNNIVWTVLILSLPFAILFGCLVHRYDVRKAKKDKEAVARMTTHRNRTILERDRNNVSRGIRFSGNWNRG